MRPKIVVATPWPVWPLVNGRRTRAFARCLSWSAVADIEIISAGTSQQDSGDFALSRGVIERRVPFRTDLLPIQPTPFTGSGERTFLFALHAKANSAYLAALESALSSASLVIACTPYAYLPLRDAGASSVIIDAQVIESAAADDAFDDDTIGREARRLIARIEHQAIGDAQAVITASTWDRDAVLAQGRSMNTVFFAVPSLFRTTDVFSSPESRAELKARSNFAGMPLVVFAGSRTNGNIGAVTHLLRVATRLPHVRFLILGTIVDAFRGKGIPGNVGFTGFVDDAQFTAALTFADACIEPGSDVHGVSAKLDAYVRCGAPLIAEPATAERSSIPSDCYVPATNRELVDAVAETIGDAGSASQRAARAFRVLYDRNTTRPEFPTVESLIAMQQPA